MYGYKTKHRIIGEYFKWVNENFPNDIAAPMLIKELCKRVSGKEINNTTAGHIYNLKLDGYFDWVDIETDKQKVIATNKAIQAGTGEYFKIKQHQLFWRAFMNSAITVANVGVAAIALWTLLKGNGEAQRLEERLMKLESEQSKVQVITNPNSQPSKNYEPTTNVSPLSDSLKKTK